MANNTNSIFLFRFPFHTPNFRHGTQRHLMECEPLRVRLVWIRNGTQNICTGFSLFHFSLFFLSQWYDYESPKSRLQLTKKLSWSDATDATESRKKTFCKMFANIMRNAVQFLLEFGVYASLSLVARHEFNLKCKTKIKVYFFRPFRAWNIHQREMWNKNT